MFQQKFSRRDFIKTSAAGLALISFPFLQSCSKKTDVSLDEFIQLSSLLTGFDASQLDKGLAQKYLTSLTTVPQSTTTIGELYTKFGLSPGKPVNLDTDAAVDLVDKEDEKLAQTITQYWYAAEYRTTNTSVNYGLVTANFNESLGWAATVYGSPESECHGSTNSWATPPQTS
ncbi:MAG TPA: sugar dehydrogenase complex small subunit [Ignavibacteria bacterium]|nr:sugar dehydrogenase complex small subunit [Ignavibacteria bacterium]